jgi:hypothetical protein
MGTGNEIAKDEWNCSFRGKDCRIRAEIFTKLGDFAHPLLQSSHHYWLLKLESEYLRLSQ